MSWYAIESVDDAIDTTRSFLSSRTRGEWLRLAIIALFVSVGGGSVSSVTNLINIPPSMLPADTPPADVAPEGPSPVELLPEAIPTDPVFVVGLVGIFVLIGFVLTLLSETLRLVFYDGLRTGTVQLRRPARRRFGQAIRLFGFKLIVNTVFAIPVVVIGAVVVTTSGEFIDGTAMLVGAFFAAIVFGLWVIASLIINRVTNEFVVPVMVLTDSGVLDAWRRFGPVLRTNLSQFGVYVVVHFLLLLAVGIGQTIVAAIIFGIVGTIGALVGLGLILGVFGGFSAAAGSTVGLVSLGIVALLTLLVAIVLYLPVNIVVLTYITSYEVSVLGAADEELQLLPADYRTDSESPETPSI
jgi:hypothetical protein